MNILKKHGVVLLLVAAAGYWYWKTQKSKQADGAPALSDALSGDAAGASVFSH